MYMLPTQNYLERGLKMNHRNQIVRKAGEPVSHKDRITNELRAVGASSYALNSMEGRHLHNVIHHDEHIGGVVYGKNKDCMAMLVATDKRVVFIDKKPMFVNLEEIKYDVVSGVSMGKSGFSSEVILHTRIKDFALKTINNKGSVNFVSYIDSNWLETKQKK